MNLLGISGKIGVGKDTTANIINQICKEEYGYPIFEIKKFAYKIKQIASILTGIPIERFEDQEFKKTMLGEEWNVKHLYNSIEILTLDEDNKYPHIPLQPTSVREFLQKLGSEAVRDSVHPNAWINALFSDYIGRPCGKKGVVPFGNEWWNKDKKECVNPETHPELFNKCYPYWIITDCRFPNEAKAIKDRGGVIIRVNRNPPEIIEWEKEARAKGIIFEEEHPSETALDGWGFDYVIDNDGNMEELVDKVKEMLIHYEIIQTRGQG